jgi:ABC-type multidrug transport system ATPase subunit
MNVASIIQAENISKSFGDVKAVDDLSLQVQQGEIYGFLGPNGSGKSTTLRMLLTLLKADSGHIKIAGFDINTQRAKALQQVGCIIEKPDFQPYLSARDNLKIFARMHEVDSSTASIDKLLNQVGLQGREKDKVKTFSHGMKQRLGLAQTLLHNPQVIILDEPNTGLDPAGIIELRETLVGLNKQEGKTILLSSHIMNEIEDIAHSMILIHKGKTVAQGKVAELLSHEQLVVNYDVNDKAKARTALQQSKYAQALSNDDSVVELSIGRNDVPHINTILSSAGVDLYGIEKSRSLERYFIKLTQA